MGDNSLLDKVWQVYEVTTDCFRVTNRVLRHGNEQFLANTTFLGSQEDAAKARIQNSLDELNGLTVVLLWSQFERQLIDLVRTKVDRLREELPESLAERLHAKVADEVEYWRINDLLNLFKGIIDANLLGAAKQIKNYRDWIVHRNPRRLPDSKTDAKSAYTILSQLLVQLQQIETSASSTGAGKFESEG